MCIYICPRADEYPVPTVPIHNNTKTNRGVQARKHYELCPTHSHSLTTQLFAYWSRCTIFMNMNQCLLKCGQSAPSLSKHSISRLNKSDADIRIYVNKSYTMAKSIAWLIIIKLCIIHSTVLFEIHFTIPWTHKLDTFGFESGVNECDYP